MPKLCRNKFWIEDPSELLCNPTYIFPLSGMTTEANLNAISRLIFIVTLVMLIFDWKQALVFLFSSLLVVIIIYYIERKMNAIKEPFEYDSLEEKESREDYTPLPSYRAMGPNGCYRSQRPNPPTYKGPLYGANYGINNGIIESGDLKENYEFGGTDYLPDYMKNLPPPKPTLPTIGEDPKHYELHYPHWYRFCDDAVDLNYAQGANNESYTSINQKLTQQGVSKMNERTKIPPVITPPMYDQEWYVNNLYVRSCINSDGPEDLVQSGYYVQHKDEEMCPDSYKEVPVCINHQLQDNAVAVQYNVPPRPDDTPDIVEQFAKETRSSLNSSRSFREGQINDEDIVIEDYKKRDKFKVQEQIKVAPNEGKVLSFPNYNPAQLQNYVPSNASVGVAQTSGIFDDYNKNLVTQTLQPGIFTRNDIIEPVNWNIGISFTQQWEPRTLSADPNGGLIYERHDGRVYQPPPPQKSKGCTAPDDVYDPRQSGYGTSYRAYIDPRFGAPKFYYDDVDDVRRPKFIMRSNVDTLTPEQSRTFADVDRTYREMSEFHRNDLSERAMEKINSLNYYRRLAPRSRGAPYNFKS